MYLMFMGPFDSTMAWNENTLMGVKRFLDRFDQYIRSARYPNNNQNNILSASNNEVKLIINKLIKAITEDFESFKYNTAIAKLMEALNKISNIRSQVADEEIKTLIKLIAPLAPYTAENLWLSMSGEDYNSLLGDDYLSVHLNSWPVAEEKYLIEDKVTVAVAINGKVRSEIIIECSQASDKEMVIRVAKENEKIKKWVGNGQIVKEIYIINKMVNLVVS
jgi:leucyl-tRNA synthetase